MTPSLAKETHERNDTQDLKDLIRRLRPGDTIEYDTNQDQDIVHDVVETTIEEGYYRVYLEGAQGGRYLLMIEKPDCMGNHPVPEAFWVNQNPEEGNNPYEVVTRGAISSLAIVAEREL